MGVQQNSYDAHMRAQHSVGEPLECEICSKTFKQLSGYRKHITLFHKNERNFGCTVPMPAPVRVGADHVRYIVIGWNLKHPKEGVIEDRRQTNVQNKPVYW
ncbi:uncharacterized protein LOC121598801 [Anopheles merus]|uniref:uncharacterized protein LOC121598801 n=1 Tax=Anopheles merus TaxID=30066 RepID=UPI001BE40ADD|nr:uncharacterized protein LOC121598801 [Anopheles merus]